jgi:mitogen-activated protein kinase kinase
MELDILHKSTSPYIVEFYGAFFIESCVYYCMEYMDAGSLDKLYGDGVPEEVLAKIAISVSFHSFMENHFRLASIVF